MMRKSFVVTGVILLLGLVASAHDYPKMGSGLDIKINKHVSFRPIGLDYYLTRFENLRTQGDNNQNNLRYNAGFNFAFGAH